MRRQSMWAIIVGAQVLALPALAQSPDGLPPRPEPIYTTQAAIGPDGKVMPTERPTLPGLPMVDPPPGGASFPKPAPLVEVLSSGSREELRHSAFLVDGEFFLMAPRRTAQDYAVVGSNPFFGPIGEIKSVDGSYDSGFRVGAGYRFEGEGVEAMFRYTFLHTNSAQDVGRPDGQFLFATATHPAGVVLVDSASAQSSINLNVLDLEVGKRFEISESMTGRLFAGPRFANLDQKFFVTYRGGDVDRDDVRRRLFFDGGGLRAGGEAQWRFFDHVGTYFRGSGSMLTGRFRGDLNETANGVPIVNVSEHFTRIVPILEMGLGLVYQKGNFRISAGYEFSTWFDMVQGFDFVDDAHPAKIGRKTGNLGFDGVVFRSEYAF